MYETLSRLLVQEFGISSDLVHPRSTARALEMDSLSLAELTVMITERTGLRFDENGVTLDSTLEEIATHFVPSDAAASPHGDSTPSVLE
ncbi:phosphopantetheine-binding protein [Streptomyces sp. NPDC020883]|uniref:phosphopantetheine-binding protein n=1 Tax=Streptomyces sp. NPDC020883 TaxID=3365099 RepID=UPI00379094AD